MGITYGEVISHRTTDEPLYGRNIDGYGRKIATRHIVRLKGDGARFRRVYAISLGNAASFYVLKRGRRVFINEWDLEA